MNLSIPQEPFIILVPQPLHSQSFSNIINITIIADDIPIVDTPYSIEKNAPTVKLDTAIEKLKGTTSSILLPRIFNDIKVGRISTVCVENKPSVYAVDEIPTTLNTDRRKYRRNVLEPTAFT